MQKYSPFIAILLLVAICSYNITVHNHYQSAEATLEMRKKHALNSAEDYFEKKKERRKNGYAKMDSPDQYAILERMRRTPHDANEPKYPDNYQLTEWSKALKGKQLKNKEFDFIERGPANVAGRTRALLILPGDLSKNTWMAAAASGGIWKTTDGGKSWTNKTTNLPNLGTNTLAMSPANPMVIYAGTGEHFVNDVDGAGMFKSVDGGETWFQIANPAVLTDFKNVSRIAIDPADENHVIATTRNTVWGEGLAAAIYRTYDGGETWERVLSSTNDRYDDIVANPQNFNTLYVAINRKGVIKSVDGGTTWIEAGKGIKPQGRIEIDISPIDTNRLFASVEGNESGTGSDLYTSENAGQDWRFTIENQGNEIPFLSGQGWYDNVCQAHPYDPTIVYVGGVNLFKVKVNPTSKLKTSFEALDNGTSQFIDYVNGLSVGGGIIQNEDTPQSNFVSVELRFGQGTQLAHRFTVNGRGSGVPPSGYEYQDYVEVPFQVWDVTNNKQLAVSFRDQQEDGQWNLIERSLTSNTATNSREYIFIHNVAYQDTANTNIALTGGTEFQQLYLIWPTLQPGAMFTEQTDASLLIEKQTIQGRTKVTDVVSDAYQEFNSINNFSSDNFENNKGVHPDQHSVNIIIDNERDKRFRLLLTNDGGVYVSNSSRDPGLVDDDFTYAGYGFNTTQFYSADKAPGVDRYIGGMQDNSTWFTKIGDTASATSFYEFAFGGDGFEAIWNNRNRQEILGSIQFNNLQRSQDGGNSWVRATTGINDAGPFVSRLTNHRGVPDKVYTVGSSGVWISENFGRNWTSSPITSNLWSFNNRIDIEVSHANPDIIWTGGALYEDERFFYSIDGGRSFTATGYYEDAELGVASGIGTHPIKDSTAYALFSFYGRPKVLKTENLGQSWEDISGFAPGDSVSSKGFPNVAVNCLLVFPNDTNRIWVGSEIGIIESLDNGESWGLINSNLPYVNVNDLKIQDDQIVVATYGRGIWSVTVEGIEREYIFAPTLVSADLSPLSELNIEVNYSSVFDSLRLQIGDFYTQTFNQNTLGTQFINLVEITFEEGNYDVALIGFKNGNPYPAKSLNIDLFNPGSAVTTYFNDFTDSTKLNDFIGRGFSVRLEPGFDKLAIHSDHNYVDQGDIFYQLKIPFLVSEKQQFSYKDVVIVETGESGSKFGEQDFYDYVVVEGSTDGVNWDPLADGYDASFNADWLAVYDAGGVGTQALYVNHTIDLTQRFAIDDVIFIRFRLSADPLENGWGWAIDDLDLKLTTPTIEEAVEQVSIYPNPAVDFIKMTLPTGTKKSLTIYHQNGQLVRSQAIDAYKSNQLISIADLAKGIYLVRIADHTGVYVQQIVKM